MAVVRRIREEEASLVAELWNELAQGGLTLKGKRNIQHQLAVAHHHPDYFCFVAEEEGTLIGFILVERRTGVGFSAGAGEIAEIYVRPAARGRGIGRALVGAARDQLGSMGVGVFWHHEDIDAPVAGFWRALGFERDVVRYSLYGD